MKIILTLLLTLMAIITFGQPYTNDNYIQNFYVSCKTGSYGAFLDLQKGTEILETDQYNRALKSFKNALGKDSSCCDAYYMMAFCNQKQSNYQEAIVNCDKSIKLNEENPSAWVIKGTTLLLLNDTVNAGICFENAIKYAPDQIDGYYGSALVLLYQNRLREALAVIKEFENKPDAKAKFRDEKKLKQLKGKLTVNP